MNDEMMNGLFDFSNDYNSIAKICDILGVEVNTPGWPDAFGESLYKYIDNKKLPKIRTLSLFSGAGGLDIGFHDLGFEIVDSVEIEKKFCNTLEQNSGEGKFFPTSKVNCIDIREFTGDDLGEIDWIIGGPPCQTFSAAGRRASGVLGTSDARGVLFREYVRLLKKLQPKGFLFENVYGIVGAQGGEPWREIVDSFKEAGYVLHYRILDAADYGAPQHRERLIIIGLKEGTFEFPRPVFGPDSIDYIPFYNAGTAVAGVDLSDENIKNGINGRYGHLLNEIPPGLNYSFFTKEMGHPNPIFAWRSKFSDFLYKADPEQPIRTIKASGGQYTGPLHWENRYFSYKEYKRLQSFPDKYEISGTKQVAVKQIGNSVPPQLARMLALAIRIQIFKTEFPFKMQMINDNVELSFRKRKRELTSIYQHKAKIALRDNNSEISIIEKTDKFKLTITEKFDFIRSNEEGKYNVKLDWNQDSLSIRVEDINDSNDTKITVDITPRSTWTLPINSISLNAIGGDWHTLTAAWKVLDRELITNNLKADIIQLNGYYQNTSQLVCKLHCKNIDGETYMKSIIDGTSTSTNITTDDLSKIWGISPDEVFKTACKLKELGYEVRNINTNPQMKENEWIIPYKFPTLVPQSVQLYKSL